MRNLNHLRKELDILKRTLLPSPEKKLGEETHELLRGYQENLEKFRQLPANEKQRILKRLNETPAVEFTDGTVEMETYADALKKSAIRNLEAHR